MTTYVDEKNTLMDTKVEDICHLHLYIPGLIGPTEKYKSLSDWTYNKIGKLETDTTSMSKEISVNNKTFKADSAKK